MAGEQRWGRGSVAIDLLTSSPFEAYDAGRSGVITPPRILNQRALAGGPFSPERSHAPSAEPESVKLPALRARRHRRTSNVGLPRSPGARVSFMVSGSDSSHEGRGKPGRQGDGPPGAWGFSGAPYGDET